MILVINQTLFNSIYVITKKSIVVDSYDQVKKIDLTMAITEVIVKVMDRRVKILIAIITKKFIYN